MMMKKEKIIKETRSWVELMGEILEFCCNVPMINGRVTFCRTWSYTPSWFTTQASLLINSAKLPCLSISSPTFVCVLFTLVYDERGSPLNKASRCFLILVRTLLCFLFTYSTFPFDAWCFFICCFQL